jgi:hypothetical protein
MNSARKENEKLRANSGRKDPETGENLEKS